ncbi:MAG: hypothetical protein HOP30_14665 [Cyclobacteriaceae bacterium]|nr:hypothetical protein [Cyclobacteriaceae bacterium]
MRTLLILLVLIVVATESNAQIDRHKIKHVKVYESADSIMTSLYQKGVDKLIAMHRVWAWENQKNVEGDDVLHASLILWAENDKYYYQLINEYAIYTPKREYPSESQILYLFEYYLINQDEIDRNPIPLKLHSDSDTVKSVKELVYEEGDFNVLTYRMGKTLKQMYWYTPNLKLNDSVDEFAIIGLKSYVWSLLIEREFRKALNARWNSDNEKVQSVGAISDFLTVMDSEMKKWKEKSEFYKKVHQYKKQEILIPKGYVGLIGIVQEQPCGKRLTIKNEVRTIKIPDDGNLILDKNYVSYFQEFKFEAERQKAFAFYVKGSSRESIPILTEKNQPDEFGLSVLGDFTKEINLKEYKIIVMYVGSRNEANLMLERQVLYNERLPLLLKKCDSK